MEIPSDLAHELVSFHGKTMSHFVEQMESTPRQSPAWDAECKFTNEVMLSIGRYEAVKALGQENATAWPEVHTFARNCIEFKENMATLLDDDDTGGSQHECIWPALVAHSSITAKLASNADAGLASLSPHLVLIHEHLVELLAGSEHAFLGKIEETRQALRKELATTRARLMKVEGGQDDGGSWKAGLADDATLPDAKKELEKLKKAYVEAIRKRIAATRAVHTLAK